MPPRLKISLLVVALTLGSGCGPSSNADPEDATVDAIADAARDAWVLPDALPPVDAGPPVCGNGDVEQGEVCDDGNLVSGDGCNSTCSLNDRWDVVGSFFTDGDQKEPALSCDASGVIAVFSDWSGLDGAGAAVRARLFGTDGQPRTAFHGNDYEFTVNTEAGGHQAAPRVGLRSDGTSIVVWADDSNATGLAPDVRGRLLAADGAGLGPDFLLPSDDTGDQATPAVAVADDGGFLAVWVDNNPAGPDTAGYGIKGRLFDQYALPQVNAQTADSGSFQINQVVAGTQFQVDVAYLGDRYLVVWADGSGQLDSSSFGVVGALLDLQGNFLGPATDFLINTTTSGLQAAPRVASQPGYGAVVVWTDDSQATDLFHYGIRARLLDLDGAGRTNSANLTDADFQVNTTHTAGQQLPSLASLNDGRFLVVWQDWSGEDGSGASVRGRLLNLTAAPIVNDLSPLGDDFQVNTTFWNSQLSPTVCAAGTWFVAMWEDESGQDPDQSGTAVRYRLLPGP
ncbi:MAG: myxococcus cysteine-rich repeat containing protein [bacterium]